MRRSPWMTRGSTRRSSCRSPPLSRLARVTSDLAFPEAGQVRGGWDDEQLMAALREAIKARQAVPSWFVETAKNAYAWHNIDAELVQLTYDSESDQDKAAVVRSENASIRALTFTSAHLSVELEVTKGSLLGQISPPWTGTLEIQTQTHTSAGVTTSPVDEIGWFVVEPIPASPFRLRFHATNGIDVLTDWITL